MAAVRIDSALVERLYHEAKAGRWHLPRGAFAYSLESSCRKAFPSSDPTPREIARYLSSLHLDDLALASACAEGHAAAWDHFVLEYRPHLYRAADVLDPSGAARELADSLYGELYGVSERGEARQSLLRYFHGRSSLPTWLRAVLAQRHVDRIRSGRRLDPVPEDLPDSGPAGAADPECPGYVERLRAALQRAVSRLNPRDRLRLSCYYAEQLTLAETGKVLREHEATVSRQLGRIRKLIRDDVERELRAEGLAEAQVQRCFECATEDAGAMSLEEILDGGDGPPQVNRKKSGLNRSV
jgi:RNA polymerase sigma factor (sigma-70 family)